MDERKPNVFVFCNSYKNFGLNLLKIKSPRVAFTTGHLINFFYMIKKANMTASEIPSAI